MRRLEGLEESFTVPMADETEPHAELTQRRALRTCASVSSAIGTVTVLPTFQPAHGPVLPELIARVRLDRVPIPFMCCCSVLLTRRDALKYSQKHIGRHLVSYQGQHNQGRLT